MTHDELVQAAEKWLRITVGCGFVLSERASGCGEQPDAIGWKRGYSYLIECKTSRSDYKAQERKAHNYPGMGMGDFRYYLTPKDLITRDELYPDWGLLEIDKGRIHKVVGQGFPPREHDVRSDIVILLSELRIINRFMRGENVIKTGRSIDIFNRLAGIKPMQLVDR